MKSPITFLVPGRPAAATTVRGGAESDGLPGPIRGRVKQRVMVAAQRSGAGELRVEAVPGEDVVVLHLAGGPSLTVHPETARDLMLAQSSLTRGPTASAPDEVRVPTQLRWNGLEHATAQRGLLGDVLLKAIEVLTGFGRERVAQLTAAEIVKRVDAQVDNGLYQLNARQLGSLKGEAPAVVAAGAAPLLVLIHGTFSSTGGTFGKLWTQHPQHVQALFKQYDDRVYGLDHATLGLSPIDNALALAQALPQGARVHLLTHSRGGLVAEVLARAGAAASVGSAEPEGFSTAAYAAQRKALRALTEQVRAKKIQVERVVRVACPARGTLLASKRLDAYLSVFKWTLELAGLPVIPELLEFLADVAQQRTDPDEIPGLAAQMPDSPLVQWLHAVDGAIPGQLRVVAGDIQGDSVTTWLKTLLADAFFWTDNDLVVQTRSMYGGAPRAQGATFLFDQGGTVSHFTYFTNPRTAGAITEALVAAEPRGFRTIGPLSWAGESSDGVRAARRATDDRTPPQEKPAVFLLPGILGSHLKVDGKRVWLSLRMVNGLKRLTYAPGAANRVEADGPIGMFYDDLAEFLAETHEVIEFGYDWRLPLEEEARRLANDIERALAARKESEQPVRIVAHSMGGLLARTMALEKPTVWKRMMQHETACLLMLGTPNAGSWAPMQVLSGDDTFGNALVALGAPFQDQAARSLMASLPGFLQLQAALGDPASGLGSEAKWRQLADDDLRRLEERSWWHKLKLQLGAYRWGIPPQAVLDAAAQLRRRLDAQRDEGLAEFRDKIVLVVGHADFTPAGYDINDEGLGYVGAADGDGRVTLDSALLPGVRTWRLDCEHGSLPDKAEAFSAYLDLLQGRTTTQLVPLSAATREGIVASRGAGAGAVTRARRRPSRSVSSAKPLGTQRGILDLPDSETADIAPATGAALRVTVVNGDLLFIHHPLLVGHYRSTRLTGSERVIDRHLGHAMRDSLTIGLYPNAVGEHQVFLNTRVPPDAFGRLPRPEAVIVVGLGDEGELRPTQLVAAVCRATLAWLGRAAERRDSEPQLQLAATLMASGGTGITVGQSAQLVAQGVHEANQRVRQSNQHHIDGAAHPSAAAAADDATAWPTVSHLQLIELYGDRANEAWRALRRQATAMPQYYVVDDAVEVGNGAVRHPLDSGYRGADYDFISAVSGFDVSGDAMIGYTVDTKRARSEVRAQQAQGPLVRQLVEEASNHLNNSAQLGNTLFKLLIPIGLEPFLNDSSDLVLELDRGTAGIPWEMLDTDTPGSDPRPWAIRTKLLRKLRLDTFRERITPAGADADVLIIGEPLSDSVYPRLPGARAEARAITELLCSRRGLSGDRVVSLISDDADGSGPDARTVIDALMERDRSWQIVHISGHGAPPEVLGDGENRRDGAARGVVLSGNVFLGPNEIKSMRAVPELVFVNCCHLGARNAASVLKPDGDSRGQPYDRTRFAATVSEQLIAIGVRCVIAAGWAVDDRQAMAFATTFYEALLQGDRFIDAVAYAREAARELGGNTWAAYQAYGDPDWTLHRHGGDAQRPPQPIVDELSGIASPANLEQALDTLAVTTVSQKRPKDEQRSKVRFLEDRFSKSWGHLGAVAYGFGRAFLAVGDPEAARRWYERAVSANDGGAPLKAVEQLGNLRVRSAWESVERAPRGVTDPAAAAPKRGVSGGRRSKAVRPTRGKSDATLDQTADAARKEIASAVSMLHELTTIHTTSERESLLASSYKRLAMIESRLQRAQQERAALEAAHQHYARAEGLARENRDPTLFYPAMNRMAVELALHAGPQTWPGLRAQDVALVREQLARAAREAPDFWSVAGLTELRMYEALSRRALERERVGIERDYSDLHSRIRDPWLWRSIYDQAAFILPRYTARASQSEATAANAVLRHLAGFVNIAPTEARATSSPTRIFVSFAKDDERFADALAKEITKQRGTVVGVEPWAARWRAAQDSMPTLEDAGAGVLIVSRATKRPDRDLSDEWQRLLQKGFSDPSFTLSYVKLRGTDGLPASLKSVAMTALPSAQRQGLKAVVRQILRSARTAAGGGSR